MRSSPTVPSLARVVVFRFPGSGNRENSTARTAPTGEAGKRGAVSGISPNGINRNILNRDAASRSRPRGSHNKAKGSHDGVRVSHVRGSRLAVSQVVTVPTLSPATSVATCSRIAAA